MLSPKRKRGTRSPRLHFELNGSSMLTTRLWMGQILVALTVGMFLVDGSLDPWHPFLFVFVVGLGLAACREIIRLLGPNRRPHAALCYLGVAAMGLANWLPHLPWNSDPARSPWT